MSVFLLLMKLAQAPFTSSFEGPVRAQWGLSFCLGVSRESAQRIFHFRPLHQAMVLSLVGLVLWPGLLLSQRFGFQNLSVGEGLAQSQVYALLEDHRGFIWMATRGGGLSRYDGRSFESYSTADGLPSHALNTLYQSRDHRLWIGSDGGLTVYDGLRFHNLAWENQRPLPVTCIQEDADGSMWVGTPQGLFLLDQDSLRRFPIQKRELQGEIYQFLLDTEARVWIGHQRGVSYWDGEQIHTYTTRQGLGSNAIRALALDSTGALWAGAYQGGIHRFLGDRFEQYLPRTSLAQALIFDIQFDHTGLLWIATQDSGVSVWKPGESFWRFYDESDGLANNHVRCILEDSWGNLWLGTSGGGVSKYAEQAFRHYSAADGLGGRSVYSLLEDDRSRLWMGVANRGLVRLDSGRFQALDAPIPFPQLKVKALHQDATGRVWTGTEGGGLALWEQDTLRQWFNTRNGLSGNWIRDIAEDALGRIWVATAGGGITRLTPVPDTSGVRFESLFFRRQEGLPEDRVNCLHVDRQGRVWFGTRSQGWGFIQEDEVAFTHRFPGEIERNAIRCLEEDPYGYLWAGTAGAGLSYWYLYGETPTERMAQVSEPLQSQNLYLLLFDGADQLWVGSESGVDQLSLSFERKVKSVRSYGQAEGFVGIETCQNAALRAQGGILWFGTINGLTAYRSRPQQQEALPPRISLNQVQIFYAPLEKSPYADWAAPWGSLKPGLVLPAEQNHLSFAFAALDHAHPQQLRYQWRLDGAESDWSPWVEQQRATYSNLAPGDYHFQVRALNREGRLSDIATASFSIDAPFWARSWFVFSAIALGAVIMLALFRLRLNQVRTRERLDREKLAIEKDLVQLEQKALRLQMNPHFIFNALNSIQGQIASQDSKGARYQLAKFSKLMRMVLENSREGLIPLEDEIQTLRYYLDLEQSSSGQPFEYEIKLDPQIDPEAILIPPMMIQPFIENALIHGLAHRPGNKGRIALSFNQLPGRVECLITDNGVGRTEANRLKSQQDHRHKSTALLVTQERLDILSEGADWGKSIEFIDLVDARGKAAGTKVIVRIPLRERA